MPESEYPIETFRYGLDTRRDVLTSLPGTLVTCENCHINQGGEIEGRKAFVDLAANTDVAEDTTYAITITSVGVTATATLATHGLSNGDYVTISGATQSSYNGVFAVSNVTTNTFDYTLPLSAASPATGSPVLAYSGTYGLEVISVGLVVFGSALNFGASSAQSQSKLASALVGVTYQQLKHPSLANDTTETYNRLYHRLVKVVASTNYDGNAFAIGQFTDGRRFLYYNGSIVQDSANGVVMEGRLAKADLSNDLLRQLQAIGWTGFANRTLGPPTSITRVGTTATLTYNAHGLSNGDTVEVTGATDTSGVIPCRYNGLFTISNVTANTFDYTIRSDPGVNATVTGCLVTVLENGATISKGPAANYYSATPSETSTSGQFGFTNIDQDGQGISGFRAEACFQITANTGPFTLTAPSAADGTGTADLCDGSVTVASSATLTAIKIRDVVNSLTFVHGYSAEVNGINVYVYAPVAWGPVTFNLTVTGATTAACVTASNQLRAISLPQNLRSVFVVNSGTVVSQVYPSQNTGSPLGYPDGTLVISASGGVQPYTYLFAPGNQTDFRITLIPNNVAGTCTASLDIRGTRVMSRLTFTANYQCTVKDSSAPTLSITAPFQVIFIVDVV